MSNTRVVCTTLGAKNDFRAEKLVAAGACATPASSRVPGDPARSATKRCSSAGMLRSWPPKTNHEGIVFHAGVSANSASDCYVAQVGSSARAW